MRKFLRYSFFGASAVFLVACEPASFPLLDALTSIASPAGGSDKNAKNAKNVKDVSQSIKLSSLTQGSLINVNVDAGFAEVMLEAIDQDPAVRASKNQAMVAKAKLSFTETNGDTKFKATVLGGIEDITDETAGVAAILTANRMLYDGGLLEAKVEADTFHLKAAEHGYMAERGKRALTLAHAWIELERYQVLENLINSRLAVLDPLLVQLESVATAGVGDVSQVASAKRTVSSILVAKTDVVGRYDQAKISYLNGFGSLPEKTKYDAASLANLAPGSSARNIAEKSPGLLAQYWTYRAAEAAVVAVRAQDDFNIGFQLRMQRPFGGSESNSDESVGLALTKNFYQGDQLKSQVERAEATARAQAALVISAYQESEAAILAARAMIKTMDTAIALARSNVESSREEIDYLQKQLVIGGSTLESVLTAEVRLYEAGSKEIGYIAERRKSVATIVALSGYFSSPAPVD